MKFDIDKQNLTKDFIPFAYKGFYNKSYCAIKLKIEDNRLLVFCIQFPYATGTSVTNAFEEIYESLLEKIIEETLLIAKCKTSFSSFIKKLFMSSKSYEYRKTISVKKSFNQSVLWIEHYPPNVGILENGTFSIVSFDSNGKNPSWSYYDKNILVNEYQIENNFLDIDYSYLEKLSKTL